MKIALIADIHGNAPALEEVLKDAALQGAELYLFAGDYIFDMPFSNEVLAHIRGVKNAVLIAGNKEERIGPYLAEDRSAWKGQQLGGVYQVLRELPGEATEYLQALSAQRNITLPSGRTIHLCHYFKELQPLMKECCGSSWFRKKLENGPFTHQDFLESFRKLMEEEPFREAVEKRKADVVVLGHNHLQGWGYSGSTLVVNPGACGQPLDGDNRAAYALLEETEKGFAVTERRVPYDYNAVIAEAKRSEIYAKGRIWQELCFLSLKTGLDYSGLLFELASRLKAQKGELGDRYSDETWEEAYRLFSQKG